MITDEWLSGDINIGLGERGVTCMLMHTLMKAKMAYNYIPILKITRGLNKFGQRLQHPEPNTVVVYIGHEYEINPLLARRSPIEELNRLALARVKC